MVIADICSAFDVLDRFDFAAAQERYLNHWLAMLKHRKELPNAFPVLNSGVMAIRKSAATDAFLVTWQREMKLTGSKRDQPALRELLYESDLRIATLPPGYNLISFHELAAWWGQFGAPRVLHAPKLHLQGDGGDPGTPYLLEEVVGRINAFRIRVLLHADKQVTPDAPEESRNPYYPLRPGVRRRWAAFKKRRFNR